jgi:hypothetical protein
MSSPGAGPSSIPMSRPIPRKKHCPPNYMDASSSWRSLNPNPLSLSSLPPDILLLIIGLIDIEDILALRRVRFRLFLSPSVHLMWHTDFETVHVRHKITLGLVRRPCAPGRRPQDAHASSCVRPKIPVIPAARGPCATRHDLSPQLDVIESSRQARFRILSWPRGRAGRQGLPCALPARARWPTCAICPAIARRMLGGAPHRRRRLYRGRAHHS